MDKQPDDWCRKGLGQRKRKSDYKTAAMQNNHSETETTFSFCGKKVAVTCC